MIRLLLFIFLIVPGFVCGQFTYTMDQSIPVKDIQDKLLTNPWAGGLNAAQYNTIDLNNDDQEDLVLFDRMADKIVTFVRENNQYLYAPEYESMFPAEITNWLLLRDYNCDGRKDIFTGDILGVKVYTNTTEPGKPFSWSHFFFFSGFSGSTKSPVLLTKGFSGKINLQTQFDDLPAIVDADGDGDLDIFNVRFVGNGSVEFHKNYSQERYGNCDSLDFERITQTWGNFKECYCGKIALNGSDCPPPGTGRTKHAGGKSLLVLDANGDGKLDVIFSEASCTQLFLLQNEGTLMAPVINSYKPFPSEHPVIFDIFPAAYYEDVDFDGKKDLISTPNIFSKTVLTSDLNHSNWFYKNTGSDANPQFNFIKSNLLQDDMIDVGDNAVPAFADYDGDGDYDMFISKNASTSVSSAISLYENTGSTALPAFKLIEEDFLGFAPLSFYNVKIQFADVNKDNTLDLVFTGTAFENGRTSLYFIANKSHNALDFSNQMISAIDFNLTYGENLFLTDVNSDGTIDILAGRSNGALEFWKNSGLADYQFTLENDKFLGLGSSVLRQNISCDVADLDADGKIDLIFGDQTGVLKIISNYLQTSDFTPISEIVFNPVLNIYLEQNIGGKTWPVAVNLFNSTKPAIVAGNILGGITILKNDGGAILPDIPSVEIYPNPIDRNKTLNIVADRPGSFQIISLLGQRLSDPAVVQAHQIHQYSLPALSAGLYLLKFTANNKSVTQRFVVY